MGSMTLVSLSHTCSDLICAIVSILTMAMWASNTHFAGTQCRCISTVLTIYLSCSAGLGWNTLVAMALLELYCPTFGDIQMPADDNCFYHCFNYVMSNGKAELTESYAMRLRKKLVAKLRDDKKTKQANRLLNLGPAGYPDEEDFAAMAHVAGISFAIVQELSLIHI